MKLDPRLIKTARLIPVAAQVAFWALLEAGLSESERVLGAAAARADKRYRALDERLDGMA